MIKWLPLGCGIPEVKKRRGEERKGKKERKERKEERTGRGWERRRN